MMTFEEKINLANNVLRAGKAISPDRFPKPSRDVVAIWADILGSIHVPVEVWPDAVKLWATEVTSQRMCTPAELKRAAKVVLERWESDPVRGPQLRAHRQALQDERDKQLAAGTFAQVRGRKPRAVEAKKPVSPEVLQKALDSVNVKRVIPPANSQDFTK